MKLLFSLFIWQAWNAAADDLAPINENLAKPDGGQNPDGQDEINMVEIQHGSNETWQYGKPNRIGPGRRRFVLAYYPTWRSQGLTRHSFYGGNRRRNHWMLRPTNFARGYNAKAQDLYWAPGNRIASDWDNYCLDANTGIKNDLYWHRCHNGQNQVFWFETWGADSSKGASHLHIGGNMGRRRRYSCWIGGAEGGIPTVATMGITNVSNIGEQQRLRVLQQPPPQPRK